MREMVFATTSPATSEDRLNPIPLDPLMGPEITSIENVTRLLVNMMMLMDMTVRRVSDSFGASLPRACPVDDTNIASCTISRLCVLRMRTSVQ
jgi:hypothetical protein